MTVDSSADSAANSSAGREFVEGASAEVDAVGRAKREIARLKAVLSRTSDAFIATSPEGIIWECNPAAERLFQYSASDMIGKSLDAFISVFSDGGAVSPHKALAVCEVGEVLEARAITRTGGVEEVTLTVATVPEASTKEGGFSIVVRDRAERLEVERELKRLLADKDSLLREVHHRVKNNLQVICSMLRLQSSYLPPGEAREMFKSSEERVYAMGLVHDKLYRSKSYAAVDIAAYVDELARQLSRPYAVNGDRQAIVRTNVLPTALPIDRAVPFGLLVNELLSNALKHGVSDDGSHSVTISLTRSDNVFHLAVSDRGRGLLDPGVLEHPRTLGLRLVHALSQQLYGRISYTFQDGAHLRVEFPSLEEGRDTDGFNKSDNHSHL